MIGDLVITTIGVWKKPSDELDGFMIGGNSLTVFLENHVKRKWFMFPGDNLEKGQGDQFEY